MSASDQRSDSGGGAPGPGARTLAHLLAPLRGVLTPLEDGVRLELEPMRAETALEVLVTLRPGPAAEILLSGPDATAAAALGRLATRLGLPVAAVGGTDHLVVGDDRSSGLPAAAPPGDVTAVIIDGPIETADVAAIARARAAGASALAADVRATVALHVRDDRVLTVEVRDRDDAYAFVAASLRDYVARLRRRSASTISAPDLGLVDRLLDRTGTFEVRPVETEFYTTALEVGVASRPGRPADMSLIYDLYTNTWHGD